MKWPIKIGSDQHWKAKSRCPTTGRLGLNDDGTDHSVMRLKWVKLIVSCSGVCWQQTGAGV